MPELLVQPRTAGSRPEVDLLLACARGQVVPEAADRIRALARQGIDWLALIRLAMRHEVMPLLHRNLQHICPDSVPLGVAMPLRARYMAQAAQAQRDSEEVTRIIPALKKQGIHALPYKGPALAQRLYGDVGLREFGDLDIMILERDASEALGLLRRLGYQLASPGDADNLFEYVRTHRELQLYRPEGTRLELQWRFAASTACVRRDPERFLRRIETIQLAGREVPSLPLETYFLILSLHATKHKWRELKLICDLAEILAQPNLDWKFVLREARDLGLQRMLAVGVLLAQDPLGAAPPSELARGLPIDKTARGLAAEVRRGLFEEPDKDWHSAADFSFQLKIRERLRDRATMLYRNLPAKLAPDERDRRFVSMPEFFASLYYLVRPVRWAWEKMGPSSRGSVTGH